MIVGVWMRVIMRVNMVMAMVMVMRMTIAVRVIVSMAMVLMLALVMNRATRNTWLNTIVVVLQIMQPKQI